MIALHCISFRHGKSFELSLSWSKLLGVSVQIALQYELNVSILVSSLVCVGKGQIGPTGKDVSIKVKRWMAGKPSRRTGVYRILVRAESCLDLFFIIYR